MFDPNRQEPIEAKYNRHAKQMTDEELLADITEQHHNIYVLGCFGIPEAMKHEAAIKELTVRGYVKKHNPPLMTMVKKEKK